MREPNLMTADELQLLKDAELFGDGEVIELSPEGAASDDRSQSPYRFNAKQVERARAMGIALEATLPEVYEPYHDVRGEAMLVPSVICQLDVLGTGAMTEARAQENVQITRRALQAAQDWGKRLPESVIARWFTDNAVIASAAAEPYEDLAITGVLLTAASMQLELTFDGLFSRGGIAVGDAYADETFVYGDAVVAAHELEDRVAHYPRIVIDGAAHEQLRTAALGDIVESLVAIDHDGLAFVSYLGQVLDDFDDEEESTEMLRDHRDQVAERLAEHAGNTRLSAKYGWVADYHDRFCRRHFGHMPDLLLDAADGSVLRDFAR
ncbi:MAG: hypothetical protein ABW167_19115 [Baekduia sp.]